MPLTVANGLTDQGKQDATCNSANARVCRALPPCRYFHCGIARGRGCRPLREPFRKRKRATEMRASRS